jgi:hypothetical protein
MNTETIAPQISLSKFRLNLMRAIYGLTFLSLGSQIWPMIFSPDELLQPFNGIVYSFWAAYSALMILGVWHPLKMIPLILLQLFYKSVWMIGVAYPLWAAGQFEPENSELFRSFSIAIIIDLLVIPWSYLIKKHFRKKE